MVDPVDGCTFWYTNQYYTGTNNLTIRWQTRIGNFAFPECISNGRDGIKGDANGDGHINILDVTVILNEILEISSAPGNGDCNKDGNVNILDVTCVLNIILQG